MKPYTDDLAREECSKAIQEILNNISFPSTVETGKTLGCLIMLATRALDGVMGSEYAAATIISVAELMSTGDPQSNTKIEIINRSKRH